MSCKADAPPLPQTIADAGKDKIMSRPTSRTKGRQLSQTVKELVGRADLTDAHKAGILSDTARRFDALK